jgi:hypothetical protein
MGNVANQLPIELQHPDAKFRVIAFIRSLALPGRHDRAILQQWGEHQGVTITPADYALVAAPLTGPLHHGVPLP